MAKKTATVKKNIDDQIEKITEVCVQQIALLHLPRNFKGDGLSKDDIDGIVDLCVVPIQEIVIGLLNATTIGYQGEGTDDDDDENDDDDDEVAA